jgi:hypothetical protein
MCDLALKLAVFLDELGDHRVELTDEISSTRARTRGLVSGTGRTSTPARRILLCFLRSHFHSP